MQHLNTMPSLDLSQLGDALGSRQLLTLEPGAVPLSAAWVPRRSHSRRTPTVQLQQSQHLQERVLLQQQLPLAQPLTSRPLPTEATSSRDLAQLDSPQAASGLNSSSLHEHPTVPDLLELEFLEGSFACSTSSGPSDKQQRKNSNFQVNFGRAIRALREDIPSFFKREGDMSIYAPDMRFQDNISARLWSRKFDLRGVSEYQRHCQRMRTIFSFLFKHSDVQVWRFWPKDRYVTVARWTVKSYPRLMSSQCIHIDGISEFRFNEEGEVQEHILDVIDWNGIRAAVEKQKERAVLAGLVPNVCSSIPPPDGTF